MQDEVMGWTRREEGGRAYRNKLLVDATLRIASDIAGAYSLIRAIDPTFVLDADQIAADAKTIATACLSELRKEGAL